MINDDNNTDLPNNEEPILGFLNGIHLDDKVINHTYQHLQLRSVNIKKENNGGYKVRNLLVSLNKDLIHNQNDIAKSIAAQSNDWDQFVFPIQESSSINYSTFSIKNIKSFQTILNFVDPEYPFLAYKFALRLFGISPRTSLNQSFFKEHTYGAIVRIAESLILMDRPEFALTFIQNLRQKNINFDNKPLANESLITAENNAQEAIKKIEDAKRKTKELTYIRENGYMYRLANELITYDVLVNDAALIFKYGLHANNFDHFSSIFILFRTKSLMHVNNLNHLKIANLLASLHLNFNKLNSLPENSIAAKTTDWDQLVFPTCEVSNNTNYCISVKDEKDFKKTIEDYDVSYPDKAYHFALNFYGIEPSNDKCNQFFNSTNIDRITRITHSLRIMGRPNLAISFINSVMAKNKAIYPDSVDNEQWLQAKEKANMAELQSLVVLPVDCQEYAPTTFAEDNPTQSPYSSFEANSEQTSKWNGLAPLINSDVILGFNKGICLENYGDHNTLELLKEKGFSPVKQKKTGGYKILDLLAALNEDFDSSVLDPSNSAAAQGDDWEQFIFPISQSQENIDSHYTKNFIVHNKDLFQQVIAENHSNYPQSAYNFALKFYGIEPSNENCNQFFMDSHNNLRVTRIANSLILMDRPKLAIDFIDIVRAKYKLIYGKVDDYNSWIQAKKNAQTAITSKLASSPKLQTKSKQSSTPKNMPKIPNTSNRNSDKKKLFNPFGKSGKIHI